jgi:hypothetical protein
VSPLFWPWSGSTLTTRLPSMMLTAALYTGFMEGLADLLCGVSKLAGGLVGHRAEEKRPRGTRGELPRDMNDEEVVHRSGAVPDA